MAPTEKGGTGGRIPQKHWAKLIEFGKEQRVDLTPADLFAPAEPSEAA